MSVSSRVKFHENFRELLALKQLSLYPINALDVRTRFSHLKVLLVLVTEFPSRKYLRLNSESIERCRQKMVSAIFGIQLTETSTQFTKLVERKLRRRTKFVNSSFGEKF